MRIILILTSLISSSSFAQADLELESVNPKSAAQHFLKDTVNPAIKGYKSHGLKAARIMISPESGCITYPCLRELSLSLQKKGYKLEAQRSGDSLFFLSIFWK
jgi:hypothetical protein